MIGEENDREIGDKKLKEGKEEEANEEKEGTRTKGEKGRKSSGEDGTVASNFHSNGKNWVINKLAKTIIKLNSPILITVIGKSNFIGKEKEEGAEGS